MTKLTKTLRRDWGNIQRYVGKPTPRTWKWFKEMASYLYRIPAKEVANRVQP